MKMRFLFLSLLSLLLSATPLHAQEQDRLFSYLYQEGVRHRMNGDYSQAYYLFAQAQQIKPSSPDALYELGMLTMALPGKDSLGGAMVEQAARMDMTNPYYLEVAARQSLQREDYDTTIDYLERLVAILPNRTDILGVLVELYNRVERRREAIATLDRIELIEGTSTQLSMQKFVLYKAMKKTKKAFAEMEKLRRDNPHDINVPLIMGQMYLEEGNVKRAQQMHAEVQRTNPHYTPLHIARMELLSQTGRKAEADALRDSLTMAPDVDGDTRLRLVYERMNELRLSPDSLGGAMQFYRGVVAKFPTPEMSALGAYFLMDNNAPEDSIVSALRDLLQVNPSDQRALELLLGYYFPRQDYEQAEEICRMGVNAYPEDVHYSFYLGAIMSMDGRREEAVEVLQSGIRQASDESRGSQLAESYSLLGDCLYQLERPEEAFAAYDSALVNNPQNAMCLNNYAYFLSLRQEQLDKAEQMAYRAIQLEPLNKTYLDTYAWVLHTNGNSSLAKFYIDRVVRPMLDEEALLADTTLNAEVVGHAAEIYRANDQAERAALLDGVALKMQQREALKGENNSPDNISTTHL